MSKQLLSNKFFLIGLGIVALAGLFIISFNAAHNASPTVPSAQTFQPKAATLPPASKDHPISGQLIVKFKPQYSDAQINTHLQQYHASVIKTIEGINQTVIKVPAGQENTIMQQLKTDPYVETAQRDITTHAFFTPNDPELTLQYALNNSGQSIQGQAGKAHADINIETAWDVTKGSGIKVAILDTGINLNHPDLAGKVVLQKSFVSNTVEDGNGHGTHVAGILAADTNNGTGVAGTCPDCQLIIGKVLDDTGNGSTSNATAGITWAADNGAKVINVSLGTPDSSTQSLYTQAVNYAMSKGAVVVAASGNCGGSDFSQEGCTVQNEVSYPAGIPGVVSVAATTNTDQKASYSNSGSSVQIAAPGDNILSTAPTHSFQLMPFGYNTSLPYMYLSGTSMATPYVAGVAALIASTSFGTTPQGIINRLYTTADKISGTGTDWVNGRVDAAAAVGPAPTVTPSPQPSEITPTLFCVGGNGTPPCATIPPSGPTIVPPASGGGTSPSAAQGSPSPSSTNPSVSPTPEGVVSTSPSLSPSPVASNPNTSTPACLQISSAFYNLASQSQLATASKTHIKCGPSKGGGGNSGGGNQNPNNGWLSQLFQLLLQLLQLLIQLISNCVSNPSTGTPAPTVSPAVSLSPAVSISPGISVSPLPSVSQAISPTIFGTSPTPGVTSSPTPTTGVTSSSCTNPTHTIPMDPNNVQNGITLDKYYISADTWNAKGFNITETVFVCNFNNWYVVAGNMTEAGGVKSYPNVHEDFSNNPQISSFKTISSTFASTSPRTGIYDAAYDIWINNMATEVMIWNESYDNTLNGLNPPGSVQATVTLSGQTYNVYKSGNYIAFKSTTPFDSGTIDLLGVFNFIISKGWIASTSTLGQIDYGIEFVSTNGTNQTFKVNNFSIITN